MIVTISWDLFHLKYFNQNTIFFKEDEYSWFFYTSDDRFVIKCVVNKFESQEENIMFIDRFLRGGQNITPALDIDEQTKEVIDSNEEASEVVEPLEENGGTDDETEL